MKNEIKLTQYPVITHKLQEAGKEVSKRIEALEIDKQVATIETVKSLKDLRAELNKELEDFETQRKFIKEGVNKPYNDFEAVYKTEISEKYKAAVELLKDKITSVETTVKNEKKQSILVYFNELCFSESIDFITFDKLGLDINLSTTEKKYKEQVYTYITKVVDDIKLIKTTDFEAEILTEYKLNLNVSNSITSVKTRKENEAKEKAIIQAERTKNRISYLNSIGLKFVEITNSYELNSDIYISKLEAENLENEDYIKKIAELEVAINTFKSNISTKENESIVVQKEPIVTPIEVAKVVVSAPVSAPIVEVKKEFEVLNKASFEVTATRAQLIALGEYMKSNNITYKNI